MGQDAAESGWLAKDAWRTFFFMAAAGFVCFSAVCVAADPHLDDLPALLPFVLRVQSSAAKGRKRRLAGQAGQAGNGFPVSLHRWPPIHCVAGLIVR